jgi:hypothetical protein
MKECQLADLEMPGSIALTPTPCDGYSSKSAEMDIESLVRSVTDAVMGAIGSK